MVANPVSKNSIQYIAGLTRSVAVDYSSADVNLTVVSRSLSCNVAGTVVLRMADDTADITRYMLAGVDYPWAVKTVKNVGTTVGMGINAGY
jgi:hypothetical protein